MRYVVDAVFSAGKPRLRVLDAVSGKVQAQWRLEKSRDGEADPGEVLQQPVEYYGMQSLLRELFLIACSDELCRTDDYVGSSPGTGLNPAGSRIPLHDGGKS